MNYWQAIIMGIVQGLTEFLPISSSGHLEIASVLFGIQGDENLLFTIVLHFATALSTLVVFRREIGALLKNCFQRQGKADRLFALKIIVSMVPAVIVGLALEDWIDQLFVGNLTLVAAALIITAVLLFLSGKKTKNTENINIPKALIIGIAQAIAILPGISRSGATIATAILLKINREKATFFSFLMVLPLIFGKIAKDILSGDLHFENGQTTAVAMGFIAAFFSGLLACKWMIALVKKSKLHYFAYYCLIVGLVVFTTVILK